MSQQFNGQKPTLLTAQIIAGALMQSVLVAAGIMVFLHDGDAQAEPVLSVVAIAAFMVALVVRTVMGRVMSNRRDSLLATAGEELNDEQKKELLLPIYITKMIMDFAPLEGAGLLGSIFFLITGQWWMLGIPAAALVIMAVGFPTQGKLESWANIGNRDFGSRDFDNNESKNSRDF